MDSPPPPRPPILPDDLDLDVVAGRLGKSISWLKWKLSEDRGEAEPKLQFHHYFGRSPKWTEDEYQQLRQALMSRAPSKGGRQRQPRPAGLAVIERSGHWYIHGRVRIKGSVRRIRESTGLAATAANREAAEELRHQREGETRDALVWGIRPSVPFEVAVEKYLNRPRQRPLNPIDISRLKELTRRFRGRHLNRSEERELTGFVDHRMKGRAAPTRERYIDTVMAILAWCSKRPRVWLSELPIFERDKQRANAPSAAPAGSAIYAPS